MHDRWRGIPGFAAVPSPAERETGRVLRGMAQAAPGVVSEDRERSSGKGEQFLNVHLSTQFLIEKFETIDFPDLSGRMEYGTN